MPLGLPGNAPTPLHRLTSRPTNPLSLSGPPGTPLARLDETARSHVHARQPSAIPPSLSLPYRRARRCVRSGRGAYWAYWWRWRPNTPRRYARLEAPSVRGIQARQLTSPLARSCCAPGATRCSQAPRYRGTWVLSLFHPYPSFNSTPQSKVSWNNGDYGNSSLLPAPGPGVAPMNGAPSSSGAGAGGGYAPPPPPPGARGAPLGYESYSNDYHQPYFPPPAPPQPQHQPGHRGYNHDPYAYAPPPPPGPTGPDYYEQQRQAAQAAQRQSRDQVEAQKERLKNRMFEAARSGDFLGLEAAFKAGVPANLMEPGTADTPLLIACREGNADMVRLCLNFGAKNDPHPDFGQTAMHAAVAEGRVAAAAVLLKAAAASQADAVICNLTDPKVCMYVSQPFAIRGVLVCSREGVWRRFDRFFCTHMVCKKPR